MGLLQIRLVGTNVGSKVKCDYKAGSKTSELKVAKVTFCHDH